MNGSVELFGGGGAALSCGRRWLDGVFGKGVAMLVGVVGEGGRG